MSKWWDSFHLWLDIGVLRWSLLTRANWETIENYGKILDFDFELIFVFCDHLQYAAKFGVDVDKLMKKLWGANFFNAKTKKWGKSKTEDNVRSFCQFILDPIYKMFDAIMNFKKEDTDKLLDKLELKGKMKYEELQLEGKFRKKFLPFSHCSKSVKFLSKKFNFDKTSGNQSCQQLKIANAQHFHEFFTRNFFGIFSCEVKVVNS